MSNRINNMDISPMNKYYEMSNKIVEAGTKVYNLSSAQPNVKPDSSYYQALKDISENINGYSDCRGLEVLRNEFAKYYNSKIQRNKFEKDNVQITLGASDAIINLLMSICDEKDSILVVEPFFCDYKIYCKMLNINIIYTTIEELNKNISIQNDCKAILFSNPNNPSGYIFNKREMDIISEVAIKNDLYIISDEVYNELAYEDFISFASVDYEKTIVVDSVSKKFNNCGARIGAIITKDKKILKNVGKIYDSRISISNTEQIAVTNMFKNKENIFKENYKLYKDKIIDIEKFLKQEKIFNYKKPKGGVFFLVTLPVEDSEVLANWILKNFRKDKKTVLILPTNEFYTCDKKSIRLSITNNADYVIEGLKLLKDAIVEYKKEGLK